MRCLGHAHHGCVCYWPSKILYTHVPDAQLLAMKGLLQSLVKQVGDAWLQYMFCARSQQPYQGATWHSIRCMLSFVDTPYIACYHLFTQDPQVQMLLVNLSNTCEDSNRLHSDSDVSAGCECRAVGAPPQTPS